MVVDDRRQFDDKKGQHMTASANPDPMEPDAQIPANQETAPPSADDQQEEKGIELWDDASVTLSDRDGLHISAELNAEGALVISGQDLKPGFGWAEYEYGFTIRPEDLPLIVAALGGALDDHVLQLLAAEGERIASNMKSWLDAIGVRYEFRHRIEPRDG